MTWILIAVLVVFNTSLWVRVGYLNNKVAEMFELVHFLAMTGGTGKAKFDEILWKVRGEK